jgi:hypothetical protein
MAGKYSITVESNFSSIPGLASIAPISATISSDYELFSGRYLDGSIWVAPQVPTASFSASIDSYSPSETTVTFSGAPYIINGAKKNLPGNLLGLPNNRPATPFDQRVTRNGYPLDWSPPDSVPVTCDAGDSYIIASSYVAYTGAGWNPGYWTVDQDIRSAIAAKLPIAFLSAAPDPGDFRPGVCGPSSNRLQFNITSDFDASRIPQLFDEDTGVFSGYYFTGGFQSPAVTPSWVDLYDAVRHYLGDDVGRWGSEHQAPAYHAPGYGERWGELVSVILLKSLFNYNYVSEGHDQDYRTLALQCLTQWGIDLWSAFKDGRELGSNGGHMQGRKAIIMAAGILLDNEEMKNPDAYLQDHTVTYNYLPGLGRFQEKHVYFSGVDPTYNTYPNAWFNGFYWGHNHSTTYANPSDTNAFQKLHTSAWTCCDDSSQTHKTKYAFGENCEPQMGQALFMLVMGLADNWSLPLLGATTQGTFGITKPFWESLIDISGAGGPAHILDDDYLINYPNHFVSAAHTSAVLLNSFALSGSSDSQNYLAYYFRKYRFSNAVHQYLADSGNIKFPIKYLGVKDYVGPYLTTNESAAWGSELVWELFQCPPGADVLLHFGKILDTPSALGNGYDLYIELNDPEAPASSVLMRTPTDYGVTIHRMTLPEEPLGGVYPRYGFQAAFSLGNGEYITTNAVELGIYNDEGAPTPPGATLEVGQLESGGGGAVVPNVKAYGSTYGSYNGIRLSDYDTPREELLNDRLAKDSVEFNPFRRSVKDYILAKLGYPVVDVELDDFQIEICIDEAISKLEYHAPDWMTQYAVFETSAGNNVYELPQVIADNLNDVWYRRDFFKFGASPGSLEYDFAIMFFTNNGLFNNYNVSQYLLMQQYLKQVKNVLGQMSTWQLINNKYLHVWPVPENSTESVILEFRAFDPATIHHAYKNWVQKFSLCLAKEILGGIRGKYETLPGPGGGARLNGAALIAQAQEEKQMLLEELTTEIEGPPLFDIF